MAIKNSESQAPANPSTGPGRGNTRHNAQESPWPHEGKWAEERDAGSQRTRCEAGSWITLHGPWARQHEAQGDAQESPWPHEG